MTVIFMIYISIYGYPFTWERGRGTERWVEERLDRAVASTNWVNKFSTSRLNNLMATCSDHSPIELQIKRIPRP